MALAGLIFGPVRIPAGAVLRDLFGIEALQGTDRTSSMNCACLAFVLGGLVGWMLAVGGASYQAVFRKPPRRSVPARIGRRCRARSHPGRRERLDFDRASAGGVRRRTRRCRDQLRRFAKPSIVGRSTGYHRARRCCRVSAVHRGSDVCAATAATTCFRQVYSWILGRLTTADWGDVRLVLPYVTVSSIVLLGHAAPSRRTSGW